MQLSKAKTRYVDPTIRNSNSLKRISVYTENFKGEFYNISVERLIPFRNQARKFFDEESIASLAETIKEHGIRQPLTIIASDIKEGCYEVVSGERRLRAAKMIGLQNVPCIIIHDMQKAEEIALIENIQRQDLHPIELMRAFSSLIANKLCNNNSEIAKKIGMPRTSVVEIMNLNTLTTDIQEQLIKNNIRTRSFLRRLLKHDETMHQGLIDKHLKSLEALKTKSGKTKRQILTINYGEFGFEIARNSIAKLPADKKQELKKLLSEILL